MIKTNRRSVLALLGSSAVSACTAPALVTRSGNDPFEGGIGGTGIVGVMTDFGSLVVNGLRVEMRDTTRVASPFGEILDKALAPGMSLTIVAERSRDVMVAQSVAVDYALVGSPSHGAGGTLVVNGATVRPEPGAIGAVRGGERIAVSGVWSRHGLIASRFDPAPDDQDLVAGTLSDGGPIGFRVSGVPVRFSGIKPDAGQYVVARGRHHESVFDAASLSVGRFDGSFPLRQLSVEGYLEPIASDPGFTVSGLGHSFARDVRLRPLATSRAIYFGPYDGRFRAAAGYVVPESFAERRELLFRGYDQGFGGEIVSTE